MNKKIYVYRLLSFKEKFFPEKIFSSELTLRILYEIFVILVLTDVLLIIDIIDIILFLIRIWWYILFLWYGPSLELIHYILNLFHESFVRVFH